METFKQTAKPNFVVCQIRGRFGDASVSPLPAPVVVSPASVAKHYRDHMTSGNQFGCARVARPLLSTSTSVLHRVNRAPRESDVQGPSFLRPRVISVLSGTSGSGASRVIETSPLVVRSGNNSVLTGLFSRVLVLSRSKI